MSAVKRISHPVFIRGPFDIFKKLDAALTAGAAYGQYSYSSTVYFYDKADETGVRLLVSGYSTSTSTLVEDNVYFLSGRLIAPNAKVSPILYFEHEMNFLIGEANAVTATLANKVSVYGFGIVFGREDVTEIGNNSEMVKHLMVTMKHIDYDNQAKQQVPFNVKYRIGGDRNLAKTFGLFQIGREVLITGYISGYDSDTKTWIVNALNISLASGHQSGVAIVNDINYQSRPGRNRARIIDVDQDSSMHLAQTGEVEVDKLPKSASSKSLPDQVQVRDVPEDGELPEKEEGEQSVNTYGKRRSNKQVINDAKKAAKYL